MTRPRILKENETYTFRRYYELKYAAADILHELGTSLKKEEMKLPTSSQSTRLEDLRERIRDV